MTDLEVRLPREAFDKVRRGAASIPLEEPVSLADLAAIPWYSLARVRPNDDTDVPTWRLITGPARYRKEGWYLPVFGVLDGDPLEVMRDKVHTAREDFGFEPRTTAAKI